MKNATSAAPVIWRGTIRRAPIPPTRDPFVNTPLLRLTPDPRTGADRFWISTWNHSQGSLAALVDEQGRYRIYRFRSWKLPGFYSAAQEDDHTLWLCGSLDRVVRFDLRTGRFDLYPTGAPAALMFEGMVLDHASGKLFAAAFPPPDMKGFVFDIRARKPVRVLDLPFPGHYMRCSFPNGDGTWSVVAHLPGEHLLIWDPAADTVASHTLTPVRNAEDQTATVYRVIQDDEGRAYIPNRGWYNPRTRQIDPEGPRPRREATWFARHDNLAVGMNNENSTGIVSAWDLRTGDVREVCRYPDTHMQSVNLTRSGKIVAVNVYGVFYRFDLATGALESSVRLPADAIGHVDCLCRIDRDRLLGTPFITQRFWEVNLKTGRGQDCGRAAPGAGEVLQVWKTKRRIYMTAYTGAELMEYDPRRPARFPENPRVVADPPGGMRPVARATDGRRLFYACSREYGHLGSVLVGYDTQTGLAQYVADPLPDQQIDSLWYDRASDTLIAGTTRHADCESCPPTSTVCRVARIDSRTLRVIAQFDTPAGVERAFVAGPLGKGRYLVYVLYRQPPCRWFECSDACFETPAEADLQPMPAELQMVHYAGRAGHFVLKADYSLAVWDFRRRPARIARRLTRRDLELGNYEVQDGSVLYARRREVVVLENCLRGL